MKKTKISGLGRFGSFIDDLDFADLSESDWLSIGKDHLQDLITVIRKPKNLTHDGYLDRIRMFGPFKSVHKSTWVKKYGQVMDANKPETWGDIDPEDRVYLEGSANMLEKTEGGNYLKRVYGTKDENGRPMGIFSSGYVDWHSNESSMLTFTPQVALLGGQFMNNSATGFCQTVEFYENCSETLRSELNDMMIVHKYTPGKMNTDEIDDEYMRIQAKQGFVPKDGVLTPMVVTSPGGIRGLHFPVNSAYKIDGMTQEDSDKLFDRIKKEIFKEDAIYDYYWENDNDLLLFDNSVCLHRRIGGQPERKAYRIQYDPSNLLDNPWMPWHNKTVQEQYISEINEVVQLLNLRDFKLPQ